MTTLEIQKNALTKVGKELIAYRDFNEELIETIGAPYILRGIASSLNQNNYFQHYGLDFSEATKVQVDFSGTFYFEDNQGLRTAWTLKSTNPSVAPLEVKVANNYVALFKGSSPLVELSNVLIENNSSLKIYVTLTQTSAEIALLNKDGTKSNTVEGLSNSLYNFTYIELGINTSEPDFYWPGSINLTDFLIYRNNSLIYSPSNENYFNFSKILISDGSVELTDSTRETPGLIYSFPVYESKRNNNSLFVTATVSALTNLYIGDIGLYCSTDSGQLLFAVAKSVNINKKEELDYSLELKIELECNIVNVSSGVEIVIKTADPVNKSNFKDIKRAYAYSIANLERPIKNNALGIGSYNDTTHVMQDRSMTGVGYQRGQVFYRKKENTELRRDNDNATLNYAKLLPKLTPHVTPVFTPSLISYSGDVSINKETGIVSINSNNGYVLSNLTNFNPDNWKLTFSFETGVDTNLNQSLISLNQETVNIPYEIYIENGFCNVLASLRETLAVRLPGSTNNFSYSNNGLSNQVFKEEQGVRTYLYRWGTEDEVYPVINNTELVGGATLSDRGELSNLSSSAYAIFPQVPEISTINDTWKVNIEFTTDNDVVTEQFLLGNSESTYPLLISITDGKLKIKLQNVNDEEIEINALKALNPNKTYIMNLTCNTTNITFTYFEVIEDSLQNNIENIVIPYEEVIKPLNNLILGNNLGSFFKGSIKLDNTYISVNEDEVLAGVPIEVIYTLENNLTASTKLYSENLEEIQGFEFVSFIKGTLFNHKNLFPVKPSTRYYIKAGFDDDGYSLSYSTDNFYFTNVLREGTSYAINIVEDVYFGILHRKIDEKDMFSNYFEGRILLENFSITSNDNKYSLMTDIYYPNKIDNYFHISHYPYSLYYANDLCDTTEDIARIRIYEGAITGNRDNLDFNNKYGTTLAIKVDIEDAEDKLLLTRKNEEDDISLTLELQDRVLIFTLYGPELEIISEDGTSVTYETEIITLQKELEFNFLRKYTDNAFTIYISFTGSPISPVYSMYLNNDLVDTWTSSGAKMPDISSYFFTNYLETEAEATKNYVKDIMVLTGEMPESVRYYMNNLLDTNF